MSPQNQRPDRDDAAYIGMHFAEIGFPAKQRTFPRQIECEDAWSAPGLPSFIVNTATSKSVLMLIERGALKALASAAPERPSIARNQPTMVELGMPDLDASIWFGLMAPAGTPRDVIDILAHALNTTLQSTDLVSNLKKQGVEPLNSTPEVFTRYVENET